MTWLLLASTSCVEIAKFTDDDRGTLASTIIDPLESDGTSDTADPPESDQEALSATASPVFCCNPLEIEFEAVILNTDRVGGASLSWDFGDGASARGPTSEHTYELAQVYLVRLTAEIADGTVIIHEMTLHFVVDGLGQTTLVVVQGSDGDAPIDPAGMGVIADAGPDQFALAGEIVTLDGSGSVNLGVDPMSFQWRQVLGPPVTVVDAGSPVTTFRAPADIENDAVLGFELTVMAGEEFASDVVEIAVAVSLPPAGFDDGAEDPQPPEDPSNEESDDPPADDPPADDPPADDPPPEDDDPEGDEVNENPHVFNTLARTERDRPVTIRLVGVDPDDDDLTFRVLLEPGHGTLGAIVRTGRGSATVTYTPDADFEGGDGLTFLATDGTDDSNIAGVAIHVHIPVDLQEPDIFTNPSWATRWLRNFQVSDRRPFGRLIVSAALTYMHNSSPEHVIEACDALAEYGWDYTPGLAHFGQESIDDWYDQSFWDRVAIEARKLAPFAPADGTFVIDWEPYRLSGHRYPRAETLPELKIALEPLIAVFLEYDLKLSVIQAHETHQMTIAFRDAGVEVVGYTWSTLDGPYSYREPGADAYGTFLEFEQRFAHIGEPRPAFFALALGDEYRLELDRLPVGKYGIYFGSGDRVPGGGTHEDYYHWGLDEWDPFLPEY